MAKTLKGSSLLLAALGVVMTVWLCPHPLAFLPYVLLFLAIIAGCRPVTLGVVLGVTLATVCVGFSALFDAAFIHLSTMNFTPLYVVVGESLVAGVLLCFVYWLDRGRQEPQSAGGDEPPSRDPVSDEP